MKKALIIEQIKEVNKHLNVCNSIQQLKACNSIELENILDRKLDELRKTCTFENETPDNFNLNQLQLKFNLTDLETAMLTTIVQYYRFDDNECYMTNLSNSEKGIIGSLVKKQLVYDCYADTDLASNGSNFFPEGSVLDFCGLQHY